MTRKELAARLGEYRSPDGDRLRAGERERALAVVNGARPGAAAAELEALAEALLQGDLSLSHFRTALSLVSAPPARRSAAGMQLRALLAFVAVAVILELFTCLQAYLPGAAKPPAAQAPAPMAPASDDRIIVNGKDGSILVKVPAGKFSMGSDGYDIDEKPAHAVTLPDYYIGRYEVTNGQYEQFVRQSSHRGEPFWRDYAGPGRERYPVVCVSWADAAAYCRWAGLRLPTEEEWEKAARGTDGRKLPWGNDWNVNRCSNWAITDGKLIAVRLDFKSGHGPLPVGMIPEGASPYGALDMAGNVWEWCDGWYRPYPGNSYRSPFFNKKYRVVRGGSWDHDGTDCLRCANRLRLDPDRSNTTGFRVCRDADRSLAGRLGGAAAEEKAAHLLVAHPRGH